MKSRFLIPQHSEGSLQQSQSSQFLISNLANSSSGGTGDEYMVWQCVFSYYSGSMCLATTVWQCVFSYYSVAVCVY